MSLLETTFLDANALNKAFAAHIASLLSEAIAQNDTASLVVSGGRTPIGLFEVLSQQAIDWQKVIITLADERWVDDEHESSNAKLVKNHLLVNNAKLACFVSLKTSDDDPYLAQSAVAQRLSDIAQPFTVTILGMGEDGHTASLFPCSSEVATGIDPTNNDVCLAVTPTTAPHQRMSLTLNAIAASEHVFLHLTGDKKKAVLYQAMADKKSIKPIVSVINMTDVTLYWAP